MLQSLLKDWRKPTLYLSFILLVVGLLFNRVLLSLGTIGILIATYDKTIFTYTYQEYKKGFWGLALFVVIPFISVFWSDDLGEWWNRMQLKIPLLIIPLSLLSIKNIEEKDVKVFYSVFIAAITVACLYSTFQYVINYNEINKKYSQGRVMQVLFEGEHQRFSLAIIGALWLLMHAYFKKWYSTKLIMGVFIFLILFMHILSTRTGIFMMYISFLILAGYFVVRNKKYMLPVVSSIILLPVLAYNFSTPFKNKIYYMLYDFNQWRHGEIVTGLSDASRVIAMNGSYKLFKQHPVIGIGYGDIKQQINDWYIANKEMAGEAEILMPPSQWMFYTLAAGIIGGFLFLVGIFFVSTGFFTTDQKIALLCFHITMTLLLLFETPFEVQRGVAIYAIILGLLVLGTKKFHHA